VPREEEEEVKKMENLKVKKPPGRIEVEGKLLTEILKEQDGRVWNGCVWLRQQSGSRSCTQCY